MNCKTSFLLASWQCKIHSRRSSFPSHIMAIEICRILNDTTNWKFSLSHASLRCKMNERHWFCYEFDLNHPIKSINMLHTSKRNESTMERFHALDLCLLVYIAFIFWVVSSTAVLTSIVTCGYKHIVLIDSHGINNGLLLWQHIMQELSFVEFEFVYHSAWWFLLIKI